MVLLVPPEVVVAVEARLKTLAVLVGQVAAVVMVVGVQVIPHQQAQFRVMAVLVVLLLDQVHMAVAVAVLEVRLVLLIIGTPV